MKPSLLSTLTAAAALVAGCGVNGREEPAVSTKTTNSPVGASTSAPAPVAIVVSNTPLPVSNLVPSTPPVTSAPAPASATTAAIPAPVAPPAPQSAPAVTLPKPPPELPASVREVVRLAQTSVEADVIVAYIDRDPEPVRLDVDQILYLRDLGVPMKVIQALLKHDSAVGAAVATVPSSLTNGPVQNVVIQAAPSGPAPGANGFVPGAGAAPVPGQGNVLLTNYLAATAGGPPTGTPTIPNAPLAPAAPVYGPGPTPVQAAAPVVVAQAPQEAPSQTYFYESLSPYGSWVQVGDYGWCWRPSVAVVNASWRPYCDDGSWLWTDNGWYWQSNYSWGWATFHYGRWHRHNVHGWVWYPGTVWGPAWVAWRYSDSHCGWAALPPEAVWDTRFGLCYQGVHVSLNFGWGLGYDHFSCVPFSHFHQHDVWRHCLPRERNVTVINNTTIINNYGNDKHSVVNHGVDKGVVERHSRSEIRKVDIRDTSQPSQAAHAVQSGDRTVAVNAFRPTIPSHSPTPPASVLDRQQSARPAGGGASGIATGATLPSRPNSALGLTPSTGSRPDLGVRNVSAPAVNGNPARNVGATQGNRPPTVTSRSEAPRSGAARPETPARPQYQSPQAPSASQPAPIVRPVGSPSGSRVPNASIADPTPSGRTEIRKPEVAPSARASFGGGEERPAGSAAPLFRPDSSVGSGAASRPATVPTPASRSDVSRPAGRSEAVPSYREPARPSSGYSAPVERSAPPSSGSYSPAPAPRSTPSPSYSAPAPRSAPAQSPSYSAPVTRSAPAPSPPPAHSDSGGGGGGGNRPSRSNREK